jgi:hypothetical protein
LIIPCSLLQGLIVSFSGLTRESSFFVSGFPDQVGESRCTLYNFWDTPPLAAGRFIKTYRFTQTSLCKEIVEDG